MSNKTRGIVLKSILIGLVTLVLVLGGVLIYTGTKISKQNDQIGTLQDVNESLSSSLQDANNKIDDLLEELGREPSESEKENYVVLTVIDEDGNHSVFVVDKRHELSIYDFLLTQKGYSVDDFQSYDGTNYYFANALTDVLELMDNTDYYLTEEWDGVEYTSLVVGLQAIVIDQDFTVVKTGF